jgi:hypothetical protein
MTLARENSEPAPPEPSTALAARLDLLVQRRMTIDQFEADMVRGCEADPEQVWSLLALLDQYHRLEKLPTELYRALKAAADRYGLVRREPYIPYVSTAAEQPAEQEPVPTPDSTPAPAAVSAAAPTMATVDAPASASAPPATPTPEAVAEAITSDAASDTPPETPFRHLLDNSPVTAGQPVIGDLQGTWQGSRYVRPPTTPPRRSRSGRVALTVVLLMAMAAAGAVWLKQRQVTGDMLGDTGDAGASVATSASTSSPPAAAGAAPAAAAPMTAAPMAAAPAPAPAAAPTVAPAAAPPPATTVASTSAATPAPAAAPPAPTSANDVGPTAAPAAAASAQPPQVAPSRPASIELAADHYTVRPGDSAARILVRRSGELGGALDFTWWTEDATAVAGTDYVAWGRRTGRIAAGRSSVTLLVPIINDSTRAAPRRFLVVIAPAGKGAQPGTITRATVQLPGTD